MKKATEMTDLRVCENCGIEFRGSSVTHYCPECRELRKAHKLELEPEQRKDGWRHMYRNKTGTVMRVGANVMMALDDLCAYEEALEAAGVRGPEELGMLLRFLKPDGGSLRKMVEGAKKWDREQKEKAAAPHPSPAATHSPKGEGFADGRAPSMPEGCKPHRRRKPGDRFCELCGHFHRIGKTGRGKCDQHPKLVRPTGRGGPLVDVPGELREVSGRRKACGYFAKGENAPQWVGPSAELMREEDK